MKTEEIRTQKKRDEEDVCLKASLSSITAVLDQVLDGRPLIAVLANRGMSGRLTPDAVRRALALGQEAVLK